MRRVNIFVHHVKDPATGLQLDVAALHRLYLTAGVELTFDEALDIEFDPGDDPTFPYPWYVGYYGKHAADCGHLIVGRRCPRIGTAIAGELWDLDWRGVCAVYTESTYIRGEGDRGLLQSAAHEIGHMLNLGHKHSSTFMTTMNQAEQRLGADVAAAWAAAEADAANQITNGLPAYYFAPTEEIDCYPLAFDARTRLNENFDTQVIPWQGRFEHELES